MTRFLKSSIISKCTPMSSRKAKVYRMLLSIYECATSDENLADTIKNDNLRIACENFKEFSNGHWLTPLSLDLLKEGKLYDLVRNNLPHTNRKKAFFINLACFAHEYLYNMDSATELRSDEEVMKSINDALRCERGMVLCSYPSGLDFLFDTNTDSAPEDGYHCPDYEDTDEEEKEEEPKDDGVEINLNYPKLEELYDILGEIREHVTDIMSIVALSDRLTFNQVKDECIEIFKLIENA